MTFANLSPTANHIAVTLSAEIGQLSGKNGMANGMAAGTADISVSSAGDGKLLVGIDRQVAAKRGDRLRFPLRASKPLRLRGAAEATELDGTVIYRASATADVTPGHDARLDFVVQAMMSDAGADAADTVTDTMSGPDADAAPMVDADVPDANDAAKDVAKDPTNDATNDQTVDLASDAKAGDANATGDANDVDANSGDTADASLGDANAGDASTSDSTADVADAQMSTDTSGDGNTLGPPTHCVPAPAVFGSASDASGSPSLAYSATSDLFGIVWSNSATSPISYNAVNATGALLKASDVVAMPTAAGTMMASPRLAPLGEDFVLAFGRRDATGRLQSAVVRLDPKVGTARAAPVLGMATAATGTSPPELGDLAPSADGKRWGVITRPAVIAAAQPTIDLFDDKLLLLASQRPAALLGAQTAAIGWAGTLVNGGPRFLAAAVTAQSAVGGVAVAVDDSALTPGTPFPFTTAGDAPSVGSTATMSVAGAGALAAITWIDAQSCAGCSGHEIFLTLVDGAGNRPFGQVQVSVPSAVSKYFPHVVFDGEAVAVAWLEYTNQTSSQVKLRRFDRMLAPLGVAIDVGPAGSPRPTLGDIGLGAAGPGDYGVAMPLFVSKQSFTRIKCTRN